MDGKQIKEFRKKAGLSKYALAKKLGIAWLTVLMWERNIYKPNKENQLKLKFLMQRG